MKKVLLLAYTNINFGDDMFVKTICESFPQQEFVLKAPAKYSEIFSSVPNLKIISETKWKKLCLKLHRKLLQCGFQTSIPSLWLHQYAAVVYVIGGLFDEDNLWHENVKRYGLELIKHSMWQHALCSSVPFYLLGCNMTRIKTDEYIEQMRYLFDGLTDICFRDQYSYRNFAFMENVRYAPDIVFNYKCNRGNTKSDEILISVWGALTQCDILPQWAWAKDKWNAYETFIVDIVKVFLAQKKKVRLLALCEAEGDVEACTRIVAKGAFSELVSIDVYDGNLDKTIRLFEQAEFIIGTRFHSVVMAINAGKPFYPIAYESKTVQLLKDVGYDGFSSHIEKAETYQFENVIRQYERNKPIDCMQIKNQSAEQFRELRTYLDSLRKGVTQ